MWRPLWTWVALEERPSSSLVPQDPGQLRLRSGFTGQEVTHLAEHMLGRECLSLICRRLGRAREKTLSEQQLSECFAKFEDWVQAPWPPHKMKVPQAVQQCCGVSSSRVSPPIFHLENEMVHQEWWSGVGENPGSKNKGAGE